MTCEQGRPHLLSQGAAIPAAPRRRKITLDPGLLLVGLLSLFAIWPLLAPGLPNTAVRILNNAYIIRASIRTRPEAMVWIEDLVTTLERQGSAAMKRPLYARILARLVNCIHQQVGDALVPQFAELGAAGADYRYFILNALSHFYPPVFDLS